MATSMLQAGATAPEFRLRSTPDRLVTLSELRGAPVILAFFLEALENLKQPAR